MTKRKSGAKPKPIDNEVVNAMAFGGASDIVIAAYLGISVDTLNRRCQPGLDTARADLKIRLQQKQVSLALAGDRTMLVWLGKAMLGQRETTEHEHSGKGGGPIAIAVTRRIVRPGEAGADA